MSSGQGHPDSCDVISVMSVNLCYHRASSREGGRGCHLLTSLPFTIEWGLPKDYHPFPLLEAPHLLCFQVQRWDLSFQGNSHSFLNLQGRQLRHLCGSSKAWWSHKLKLKLSQELSSVLPQDTDMWKLKPSTSSNHLPCAHVWLEPRNAVLGLCSLGRGRKGLVAWCNEMPSQAQTG